MPQKATHRRPWSPHGSSAGSDMFNTHPRFHRRMSEPIPKLSGVCVPDITIDLTIHIHVLFLWLKHTSQTGCFPQT